MTPIGGQGDCNQFQIFESKWFHTEFLLTGQIKRCHEASAIPLSLLHLLQDDSQALSLKGVRCELKYKSQSSSKIK